MRLLIYDAQGHMCINISDLRKAAPSKAVRCIHLAQCSAAFSAVH